ncbi:MAG: S-layer homology domain-containing protein [Clostridia bacterium]|nr:S-layer homology domain-containing protein [Clostridia bacterium]
MKRIISCVLILVMLMAAIPASAAADKTARLVLDAPYGVVGQELEVQIRVENMINCGIFGLALKYDHTVLKPTDFVNGLSEGLTSSEEMEKGTYSVVWVLELTNDLEKTLNGDAVIGTLKFKVLKNVNSVALEIGDVQIASTSEDDLQPVTYEEPIIPLYKNHPFTDITADWYKEAVLFAYNNKLMNGVAEKKFDPDGATTRGMLTTILYRKEFGDEMPEFKKAPFTDLQQNWYKTPINWAFEKEIVKGESATLFAPEKTVTREQIATMLYRYAKYDKRDVSQRKKLTSFSDSKKVNSWAKEAMEWAYAEGLITGNSINGKVLLDPQGAATRAQIATILMRYIRNSAEQ